MSRGRSEIELLPEALRALSLSDREIVLPYPEVMAAIEILVPEGIGLLGWEGWARYPHGHGHYSEYPGITLEPEEGEEGAAFVARSAAACRSSIESAWEEWSTGPHDQRVLYFCLTGVDEGWVSSTTHRR